MYNIGTHYVHTHTQAHLISAGGPMQMSRTKAQYVKVYNIIYYVREYVRGSSVESEGVLPGLYYN